MIDMHSHFLPPITRELAAATDRERAPWLALALGADGDFSAADRQRMSRGNAEAFFGL